ncbi:MAG: hypothetical protein JO356_09870 [Acidobacteria bacterium]|nr:hypothetical protein [Acidobacteriota bacterium]
MDCKSMLATLCALLLIYAPLAESASPRALGTLSAVGTTEVNGNLTRTGTSIFPGDHIVNQDASSTAVSLEGGSRLILTGTGALEMEKSASQPTAKLEKGSIAVLTHASAPVALEAAGTRITGGSDDAVYAVTVNGNDLEVTSSKGKAEVEGAGRTVEVPEGKTLLAKMTPPFPREPQTGAPPAASGGGAGRFFTFEHIVIIAAAAGAATALALAIKDLNRTCKVTGSPSTVTCD